MKKDKKHQENSQEITVISRENRLKNNTNNFNNKISPQFLDQATKKIKKLKIVLKFQHKR